MGKTAQAPDEFPWMEEHKKCSMCGKFKGVSQYTKAPDRAGGYRKECKRCHQDRSNRYYKENKSKVLDRNREYRSRDPLKWKLYRRDWALRNQYGVTLEEFNTMKEIQGGVCAINGCGRPIRDLDHCHSSGKVRQLLCGPCNKTLGLVKDSIERLRGLVTYLESHSESKVAV